MDVLADARTKAGNAFAQFMLACVYVDSRGWRTDTYCEHPRLTRIGELDHLGFEGQDRVTVTNVLIEDLALAPKADDLIEIAESVSSVYCGQYRVTRPFPNDGVEALMIIRKLP